MKTQVKTQVPIKKEGTEETRNHHVKTRGRMPRCEAVVCDIKRHLRAHVKRDELHTVDIEGHAEIMRLGKRKFMTSANNLEIRGGNLEPEEKRGPVAGCKTICARLDKHLLSTHQMKIGSAPYKIQNVHDGGQAVHEHDGAG